MNAKQLIAALAVFAAAGSAYADVTGHFTDFVNMPSSKTRAEVIAELQQARADGSFAQIGSEYHEGQPTGYARAHTAPANPATASVKTKTRADVLAELQQARAEGTHVVGGNEFSDPVTTANSGLTREAVRNAAFASTNGNQAGAQESGN